MFSVEYEFVEDAINAEAFEFIEHVKNNIDNEDIEFTGTIKDIPKTAEGLRKFRDRILLGRRIALGLYYHCQMDEEKIFVAMMPNAEVNNKKSATNQLMLTTLALSLKKDLPKMKDIETGDFLGSGLLEEEIKWLIKFYDISFNLNEFKISENNKESVVLLLSEIKDELKSLIQTEELTTKEIRFFKFDFEKINTVKAAKDWFNVAFNLSQKNDKFDMFQVRIQQEINEGYITNENLITFFLTLGLYAKKSD